MDFPKHINMHIEHQPHASCFQTVEEWLKENKLSGYSDTTPEDEHKMIESDSIWTIQWYPDTPVGFYSVAAASLERCVEISKLEE